MNEIIIYRPESLSNKLLPVEKECLLAKSNPMIMDLKITSYYLSITQAMTKAYMVLGHSIPDTFELMVDEVLKELKSNFSTFTVQEICLAIDFGSKGKLTDEDSVTFISVHNILLWIHKYNYKVRREAIAKQILFEDEQEKESANKYAEEKEKDFELFIVDLYNNFPESFNIISKGVIASAYRQLDKKKIINLTIQEKNNIFNSIVRIKRRLRYAPKRIFELTEMELAQYRALKIIFKQMKSENKQLNF